MCRIWLNILLYLYKNWINYRRLMKLLTSVLLLISVQKTMFRISSQCHPMTLSKSSSLSHYIYIVQLRNLSHFMILDILDIFQ